MNRIERQTGPFVRNNSAPLLYSPYIVLHNIIYSTLWEPRESRISEEFSCCAMQLQSGLRAMIHSRWHVEGLNTFLWQESVGLYAINISL